MNKRVVHRSMMCLFHDIPLSKLITDGGECPVYIPQSLIDARQSGKLLQLDDKEAIQILEICLEICLAKRWSYNVCKKCF